jgi:hypothetical protein
MNASCANFLGGSLNTPTSTDSPSPVGSSLDQLALSRKLACPPAAPELLADIRVKRVAVSGRNTAGQSLDVTLIKRSTLDSGGTAAGLTAVSHDSLDPAASATATSWTTVPVTPGTSVGLVRAKQMTISGTGVLTPVGIEWDFSTANDKAAVLRNANEGLYLNLPAAPASTATLNIFLEWSEE